MPHLLAITPYPLQSADTRYRIGQFIPHLVASGWRVTLRPFMDESLFAIYNHRGRLGQKIYRTLVCTMGRVADVLKVDKEDVIFLHKEAFPFGFPWLEQVLKRRARAIVYDMDDAYWTHPPQFRQIGRFFRDPGRIRKIIALSNVVLAGNSYLADFARKHNSHVVHFPTVLDTNYYQVKKKPPDQNVIIGWVGRWSSQDYLKELLPVFRELIGRFPLIRLRFIGVSPDFSLPGIPIEILPWRLEEEVSALQSFDIGIMPLADDDYSRGKCGFKLLQYMALGIPGVASPVGVNSEIIQDGVNGFLASSPQVWLEKLSQLIIDKQFRVKLGHAGRRTVEELYSLDTYAPKLVSILNGI